VILIIVFTLLLIISTIIKKKVVNLVTPTPNGIIFFLIEPLTRKGYDYKNALNPLQRKK